jgi:hypothetical protein
MLRVLRSCTFSLRLDPKPPFASIDDNAGPQRSHRDDSRQRSALVSERARLYVAAILSRQPTNLNVCVRCRWWPLKTPFASVAATLRKRHFFRLSKSLANKCPSLPEE